jgi:hypothetical protein
VSLQFLHSCAHRFSLSFYVGGCGSGFQICQPTSPVLQCGLFAKLQERFCETCDRHTLGSKEGGKERHLQSREASASGSLNLLYRGGVLVAYRPHEGRD